MTDYRPGIDDADYLRNAISAMVERMEHLGYSNIGIAPNHRLPGYGFHFVGRDDGGFPIDADLERNIFRALVANGYAKPSLLEA